MAIRNKGYVWVEKYEHPTSGEKWYTPFVRMGIRRDFKPLRLSWDTKTKAEIYGDEVYRRWVRLTIASKKEGFHVLDRVSRHE